MSLFAEGEHIEKCDTLTKWFLFMFSKIIKIEGNQENKNIISRTFSKHSMLCFLFLDDFKHFNHLGKPNIFSCVPYSAINGNQFRTFGQKFFVVNFSYRQDYCMYLVKNYHQNWFKRDIVTCQEKYNFMKKSLYKLF